MVKKVAKKQASRSKTSLSSSRNKPVAKRGGLANKKRTTSRKS